MHGKDADFVAQHVFKTASVIKTLGKGMRKINSVVLRPIIAKSFLREALTARQMRVEIWAMEGGNKNKWDVQRQASDVLDSARLSANSVAGVTRQSAAGRGFTVR